MKHNFIVAFIDSGNCEVFYTEVYFDDPSKNVAPIPPSNVMTHQLAITLAERDAWALGIDLDTVAKIIVEKFNPPIFGVV